MRTCHQSTALPAPHLKRNGFAGTTLLCWRHPIRTVSNGMSRPRCTQARPQTSACCIWILGNGLQARGTTSTAAPPEADTADHYPWIIPHISNAAGRVSVPQAAATKPCTNLHASERSANARSVNQICAPPAAAVCPGTSNRFSAQKTAAADGLTLTTPMFQSAATGQRLSCCLPLGFGSFSDVC